MRLVYSLALADIARDFRRTHDFALGIPDWRNAQRNVNQASILPPTDSFVMLDALAAPKTCKISVSSSWS